MKLNFKEKGKLANGRDGTSYSRPTWVHLKPIVSPLSFHKIKNYNEAKYYLLLASKALDLNVYKYLGSIYKKQNKPKCYYKVKGIKEYVNYVDVDGKNKLGAITKTNKLNEFNLSQIFNKIEIQELKDFVSNDKR